MVSAPFVDSAKVAAPPKAVLSALAIFPIVMPGVTVTLACGPDWPVGPTSPIWIVPFEKPPASAADRPVAVIEGAEDWNRSLSPKNWEKAVPPRLDGVDGASCMTIPLPPVADSDNVPLEKLAEPSGPSAELSAVVKLPIVVPILCEGPPFTDN